jgi:molybdate transport system ATP-binding protein
VLLDAVVGERDDAWHLIRADFPGGGVWVRDSGRAPGAHVRVRILARDVSLSLEHHEGTGKLNLLPGTVTGIADDIHAALTLVRVEVGTTPIIARVTRRSSAALGLAAGTRLWVQIKAVALIG